MSFEDLLFCGAIDTEGESINREQLSEGTHRFAESEIASFAFRGS